MVKLKNKLINIFYVIMMIFSFLAFYGTLHEVIESFNYESLLDLFLNIFLIIMFIIFLIDNIKEKRF
jgi:hypothetical protein